MDPSDGDLFSLPPGDLDFMPVDTISTNDRLPQELIRCILEHEAAGTPFILTGLNSGVGWPSVVSCLLGRTGLVIES